MKAFFAKIKNFIVNHKVWSSVIAGALTLSILAGIFIPNMLNSSSNRSLTRADWAEILKSNFGVVEYDTDEPFFSDVSKDDALFAPAQALKERQIIDYEKTFDHNKKVNFGEMLSHVSKLYGVKYIENRLEKENATEAELKDYIRKQTPFSDAYTDSKVLTVEQATQWMNAIHEKYLDREFGNSYSATYKQNVREMFDEAEYSVTDNTLKLKTDKDIAKGEILILGGNNEHISGIVRKVDEVVAHTGEGYTLAVSKPETEEVIEEMDFEFSKILETGEFVPAEGITVVENRESQSEEESGEVELNINPMLFGGGAQVTPLVNKTIGKPNVVPLDKDFNYGKSGTFFDRSITCSSDLLKLNSEFSGSKFSNSNDNYADSFYIDKDGNRKNKYDSGYEVELGLKLSNFKLYGSVDYRLLIHPSAFTVNASIDVTPYFAIRGNASTTIKIGHIPCNIGYGFAADIDINLVVSINGEISVQPTIHCKASATKDNYSYSIRGSGSTSTDTEVDVNGNLNISVGPDVTLSWCDFVEFADVYAYIGVGASCDYTTKKPDVITASIYLPTLHIGIGENEDTLLSKAREAFTSSGEKIDLAIIDNNGGIWRCPLTYTREFKLIQVKPMSWSFKDGVLTVSGGGKIPDYMGENASETLPPWYRETQTNKFLEDGDPNPVNIEIKKVVVEEGITSIGAGAFASLSGLEEVVMPNTVTEIGISAFSDCKALETIKLPDVIVAIEEDAFAFCESLKSVEMPKYLREIDVGAFRNCTALVSVKLNENLERIGAESFMDCSSLKSIDIPDKVKTIGYEAFNGCTSLRTVNFGKGVSKMGRAAFAYCTSLEKVVLPDNMARVPMRAFWECASLKEVVFSSGTKELGLNAFGNCRSLTKCDNRHKLEQEEGVFYNCIGLGEHNYGNQDTWAEKYAERGYANPNGIGMDGHR